MFCPVHACCPSAPSMATLLAPGSSITTRSLDAMPDPAAASDRDWADYVFIENNTAGVIREWWCHVPTSFWFIAERNTVTDEIIKTYAAGEVFNTRVDFAQKAEKLS